MKTSQVSARPAMVHNKPSQAVTTTCARPSLVLIARDQAHSVANTDNFPIPDDLPETLHVNPTSTPK